jgi:hypothetical protein
MNRPANKQVSQDTARVVLAGRPFDVDAKDVPGIERDRSRLEAEIAELNQLGLPISSFQLPPDAGPPRYDFSFPEGELQYKTRHKLEAAGFDVGQHMVDRRLSFYLSRRVHSSEGWQT